jgi:Intracellular proteinase inhibitor
VPGWLKSGMVVLTAGAWLLVVVAAVVFVSACTSEPARGGSGTTSGSESSVVLTVEQALAAEDGQELNVQGALVSTGSQTVLASALAESYPPQAGGATLALEGLDMTSLVGLTSSAGQAGVAEATWSDYWLVLKGVVNGGILEVTGTPRTEEDTSVQGVRLRFSPVSEPIKSGDQVWWALDVTNTGQAPVRLLFPDGQRGDVTLLQGDVSVYAWSDGKSFAQVVETMILEQGESLPIVLNDTLDVASGDYSVWARVTAMVGPSGSEVPLPGIASMLTVH